MEKLEIKPGTLFKNNEGEWRVMRVANRVSDGKRIATIKEVNTEKIDRYPVDEIIFQLCRGGFEYLGDVSERIK